MSKQRTYTGHSGQMAVMAELLFRQCNVAVPDVDWGTDVFAFQDEREDVSRIQVKAAVGTPYKREEGYSIQFDIPIKQLNRPDRPPLHYALVARIGSRFADFLILSRPDLSALWNGEEPFGTENKRSGNLVLTVQFRPNQVRCGGVDLTQYRNAWDRLPALQPPIDVAVTEQAASEDAPQA
jgi:hypothetical protein